MFSTYQRLSTVTSFAVIPCLFALLSAIALSSFIMPSSEPFVSLKLNNIKTKSMHEDPFMRFNNLVASFDNDLQVDFTPIFHWNVKMVFAYLVFEYQTKNQKRNEIVIWDKIIMSSTNHEDLQLNLKGLQNKYLAADLVVNGLKNVQGTLKLYWNTVPNVGYLFDSQKGVVDVKIPGDSAK